MKINTQSLQPLIQFIYSVADQVLINTYEPSKYKDVILPMTVIRRLDAVLEPTKNKVLESYEKYKGKLNDLTTILTSKQNGSGQAFYNTSTYTLKKLLDEPKSIRTNFENYLNGFSDNVQDIISKFKFRNEIETLDDANKLFSTIEKFVSPKIDLRPESLPPLAMGYVFEDLLRRFFFFSSRRRHTRSLRDWSSDVCSSDLVEPVGQVHGVRAAGDDERD